jgi:hypothetical protein
MRGSLSGSCVSNIACNVDASETIPAARQLGVDAAVSGGGGNAAAVGYCPGNHAGARSSDCSANACAANARAGDPRTATFPRHASRHHAYSPHHRDPATGVTSSAATGTGQPCPSPTGTCGASANSPATHGVTVHSGRRDCDADPNIRSSARQYLRAGWDGADDLEPR